MQRPSVILLGLLLAAPVAADTVYLENGRSFEEVIAEAIGDSIRIRLPYGEIVLPSKAVARVERSPSAWQQYLERERLLRSAGSPAADWLELARWSEQRGFQRGLETAALVAARLEPRLTGLDSYMTALGYVLDSQSTEWLTEAELMRRRGYVSWRGRWVTPEARQAALGQHEAREAQQREERRQERITRAIEALAVAQLSRPAPQQPVDKETPPPTSSPLVAVFPGYFPFLVASPKVVSGAGSPPVAPGTATFEDLVDRQPGSLFPVSPRRRHLTSSDSPSPGRSG